MDIQVLPLTSCKGGTWEVRLDRNKVPFRSEADARAFVETLKARLAAPHQLPAVAIGLASRLAG
jgi:hypothetical protein